MKFSFLLFSFTYANFFSRDLFTPKGLSIFSTSRAEKTLEQYVNSFTKILCYLPPSHNVQVYHFCMLAPSDRAFIPLSLSYNYSPKSLHKSGEWPSLVFQVNTSAFAFILGITAAKLLTSEKSHI